MIRSPFFVAVPVLGALLACGYGDHDHTPYVYDDPGACTSAALDSNIDADVQLDVQLGRGVGVFVEYMSGGHWHVFVTCDTEETNYDCAYDVIVQPLGGTVLSTAPDGLEPKEDQLYVDGSDAAELVATTAYDSDGFYLDTEPGAALNVTAYLDDACMEHVFWSGDGAVHSAPSLPINLIPVGEAAE